MKKAFLLLPLLILLFFTKAKAQVSQNQTTRSSALFRGIADYMEAGTSNRNITDRVTLEAWIKTQELGNQWIAGKFDAATNQGFYLELQNGKAIFAGRNASGGIVSSGLSITTVNDNNWHHVAGIFDQGNWFIYIDGIQESGNGSLQNTTTLTSSVPFTVARNSTSNTQYFNGRIGEVKLWNTARTENELRTFMCKVVKNVPPELVAYYKFDWFNEPLPNLTSPDKVKDNSAFGITGNLLGLVNYSTNHGPPIGDESIFYYGPDKTSQVFKLGTELSDTVTLKYLTGTSKGIHFYRSDTYPIVDAKANFISIPWYFGVYTFGDPNATYQVTYTHDSTICNGNFYVHKRFDSATPFRKLTSGRFDPEKDKATQLTETYRGEYTFLPHDIVKVFFNGTLNLCPDNFKTVLTATTGDYFTWNTGETTKSITVTKPGKYYVKVLDICTSVSTDTFRVVAGQPIILPKLKTTDTLICQNEPLLLSLPEGFSYSWQDGSTANTFTVTSGGTYSVTVTDPRCGNSSSSAINVKTVACNEEKVFIPNLITPNNDGLNDYFTAVGLTGRLWSLRIYNRWGQQVYQSLDYQNNWKAEGLNAGTYYYFFQSPYSVKTYKGWIEVVR